MLRATCAACLIAVTIFLCMVLHAVKTTVAAVPVQMDVLAMEVHAGRLDLEGQLNRTQVELLKLASTQMSGIRQDARGVIAGSLTVANQRIGDSLARVDTALATVDHLRTDLEPTLANVEQITTHANEASAILFRRDALPAQLLGVTAAAKVTLGQTALTMRTVQDATPKLMATIQDVGTHIDDTAQHSSAASEETRRLMFNLAEETKPLPKWIRYPFQILGLIAPSVSGAVGTAAAMGAFAK